MAVNPNIVHLKTALDKTVDAFSDEVKSELFDNSLIGNLTAAIDNLKSAIYSLERRGETP